jgi:hypothetical protein
MSMEFGIVNLLKVGAGKPVSIVTDYRLGDWGSIPNIGFPSRICVQTGSEAHPASYPMGNGRPFPGVNRGRGVTLTTHPHLVPKSRMNTRYISSHP